MRTIPFPDAEERCECDNHQQDSKEAAVRRTER